jgi:hypothetical protein
MALPVYSSRDVSIAWAGVALDGLAPDTFVTFSRSVDLTDEEVGSDGKVAISRTPDKTGSCTLSFQQNSEANLILSGVMAAQEGSSTFITGSITVVDPSGSTVALLTNCHIKTAPETTLGITATGQSKDWVFFCEGMNFTSAPEGVASSSEEAARIASGISTILGNI